MLFGFNIVFSFCIFEPVKPKIFEDIGWKYLIFLSLIFYISRISTTDRAVTLNEYDGISKLQPTWSWSAKL